MMNWSTSPEQIHAIASQLSHQKDRWLQTPLTERIQLLQHCVEGVKLVAADWVKIVSEIKGIAPTSLLAGEIWMTGPAAVLRNLRLLIAGLQAQLRSRSWKTTQRPNGQTIVRLFPDSWMDQLLLLGYRADLWIEPGRSPSQGLFYRQPPVVGRVALVLGGGNISSIAPMDVLYKLFAEQQVVILKMHPVMNALGPILEQAFEPLRERSLLAIVYGDRDIGHLLCHHPAVDTVHITGSHHTHDAIVWGDSEAERQTRKAKNRPVLAKPITSELGCVTPILVVPGRWRDADLSFQAQHVANMVAHNASFNCVAAKVVVTASGWPQREEFLNRLHAALAAIPPRSAYYPGAAARYQAFLDRYPQAKPLSTSAQTTAAPTIPWTVIPNVSASPNEYALTHEAFCGILAELTLEAETAAEFLPMATAFANDHIWGTLSCSLLIDPATAAAQPQTLDEAIAQLHYGTIAVNTWSGIAYSLGSIPWGAFPGNALTDIGSGRGVVHNAYLFDHPQKTVLYAPFRVPMKPFWFTDHSNLHLIGQRLAQFEAHPTWGNLLMLAIAAAIQ
jgi:acyl-CoA reductase-like NAD-dependent aldehyde dehydrogenase